MKRFFGKLLFKIYGWKLVGSIPPGVKKGVIIAAPHTSNMDFFLALPTMWQMNIKGSYLIKKEWFKGPIGWIIRLTGGIPVERGRDNTEFVEKLKQQLQDRDDLFLLFTPEGTRKAVPRWKTGFYRVAVALGLPIILAYADYKSKQVHIEEVFYPEGDFEKDFTYLENFFKKVNPKFPDQYNPVIFERRSE